VFRAMALEVLLESGGRSENAMKKRSIKETAKKPHWPFRGIYKITN